MRVSPLAGKAPPESILIDIHKLVEAYYNVMPKDKVQFGTSGHRGTSLEGSFNERHLLAIAESIYLYRKDHSIDGPLFLGYDTHALSLPALKSVVEVLTERGVTVMLSVGDEYVPTPAVSHAILKYNRGRKEHLADGIVITPSHNPPGDGGIKYNPPSGGPADTSITNWIQDKANSLLENFNIQKIPYEKALLAPTTKRFNYLKEYVDDLSSVIDMEAIKKAKIRIGVDPLGGAGIHYWKEIAKTYEIDLEIVNQTIDKTFRFMTVDWDGKIRMDPSSQYAMQGLIQMKDRFDIAFACDTDYDRHGIVTKSGLLPSNHFLTAAIYYLFQHRPHWNNGAAIGKTLVSSQMIDRVAKKLGRKVYEVPVGFKWFVEGLLDGSLGFTGEESAGASFLRKDGSAWTTDKDGIILCLLAAEMTASLKKNPAELYQDLTKEFGTPFYDRVDSPATAEQRKILAKLSPENVRSKTLAGEEILSILTKAPGNNAPIGGVKVIAANGWFAARPSGTENITKIYGESFLGREHLDQILKEAETIVNEALDS